MRIAFVDFFGLHYDACSVDSIPLGGTESAACYLTRALARQEHEVYLAGSGKRDGTFNGVHCVSRLENGGVPWRELDAAVCMGAPESVPAFRSDLLGPQPRLVLWVGHAADQLAVQFLRNPAQRDAYDGVAMVSQWQLEDYHRTFAIDRTRMAVMRNAIGFAFERQFASGEPILPHKSRPFVLAYTSTPFRGLNLLLDAFPQIRRENPGTRLKVFSSMQLYQVSPEKDQQDFGPLYRRCMEMEGVEYIGPLAQPRLATAMREVAALTYPNTFAETSCIGVMEAMASGCRVVTSEFGALPETSAGFARLVRPGSTRQEYLGDFIRQTVKVLRDVIERPSQTEEALRRQVDYTNNYSTWASRAAQWVQWLQDLPRRT